MREWHVQETVSTCDYVVLSTQRWVDDSFVVKTLHIKKADLPAFIAALQGVQALISQSTKRVA